jgi:TolB-like protein
MKKILCLLTLSLSAVFCVAPGYAQSAQATGTLGIAVTGAKSYAENLLPQGTRVLIAAFAAPTKELGAYIADELSERLVNGRRLTLVERSAEVLQSLGAETGYQLSGEVSDDSIQSIGYKTGAEVVVTGSITGGGDQYRISVKLTGVKTAEVQGQWSTSIQTDTVLNTLLTNTRPTAVEPQWTKKPLSARAEYEPDSNAVSNWYYDVGLSNMAASERLARDRARQNVQQNTAENIAKDIQVLINATELTDYMPSSGNEDSELRIEAAFKSSIKTRVPRYELLEWYIETGKLDGKNFYIAYVLVRFPRKDILDMVENMEPAKIIDAVIQQLKIPAQTIPPDVRSDLVRQMQEERDKELEEIRLMRTGH